MPMIPSWLEEANDPDTLFPVNNLPCGLFSYQGETERQCGVAIGNHILNITLLETENLIDLAEYCRSGEKGTLFGSTGWNSFMALGPKAWKSLRDQLTNLLRKQGNSALRNRSDLHSRALPLQKAVTLHLPFQIAEYTDFYANQNHARNVGTILRGADNALPPNWLHMPIGYNGRASSVIVSGTDFHRPWGQIKPAGIEQPKFMPSHRFDFELELGAVIGQDSQFGQPVTVQQADAMIFGYVLLNDWSARDIQAWEYQPLGPFQAKATATSISPWIVMREALEPFRVSTPPRQQPLLPYLAEQDHMLYDIELEVWLQPEQASASTRITRTNYREMYYSTAQQLAHHTISGCPMRIGDLLGSGTISGGHKSSQGSLLELSWGGKEPLLLADGIQRTFLEDGDSVLFLGQAQGDGYRIGFGDCRGRLLPALAAPL